jgi:hypothetical protein
LSENISYYTPPDDLESKPSIGDSDPDDAVDDPDDSEPGVELYSDEDKETFTVPPEPS